MDKSFTSLTYKKGPSKQQCSQFIERFKSVVLMSTESERDKTESRTDELKHNEDESKGDEDRSEQEELTEAEEIEKYENKLECALDEIKSEDLTRSEEDKLECALDEIKSEDLTRSEEDKILDDLRTKCNVFRIKIGSDYVITINTGKNRIESIHEDNVPSGFQTSEVNEEAEINESEPREIEYHDIEPVEGEPESNGPDFVCKGGECNACKPPSRKRRRNKSEGHIKYSEKRNEKETASSLETINETSETFSKSGKFNNEFLKTAKQISRKLAFQCEVPKSEITENVTLTSKPGKVIINEIFDPNGLVRLKKSSSGLIHSRPGATRILPIVPETQSEINNETIGESTLSVKLDAITKDKQAEENENSSQPEDESVCVLEIDIKEDILDTHIDGDSKHSFRNVSIKSTNLSITTSMKEDLDARLQADIMTDLSSDALCSILSAVLEEMAILNNKEKTQDPGTIENIRIDSVNTANGTDDDIVVVADNYYIVNIDQLKCIGEIMNRIDQVLNKLLTYHKTYVSRSKHKASTTPLQPKTTPSNDEGNTNMNKSSVGSVANHSIISEDRTPAPGQIMTDFSVNQKTIETINSTFDSPNTKGISNDPPEKSIDTLVGAEFTKSSTSPRFATLLTGEETPNTIPSDGTFNTVNTHMSEYLSNQGTNNNFSNQGTSNNIDTQGTPHTIETLLSNPDPSTPMETSLLASLGSQTSDTGHESKGTTPPSNLGSDDSHKNNEGHRSKATTTSSNLASDGSHKKIDKPRSRFKTGKSSKHRRDAAKLAEELLDLLTDVEKLLINNCADRYEMMILLEQIMGDYGRSARKAVADLKKFIVTFNKNNSYL
ncbi:hypothetical protein M8J75_000281 [Diaphorina citri]|nr:hypothetical protein M8J75_000281 [Diaphorina citri]KAI5721694.1 hypothetical protein M8J77_024316 [Diaphorina citri]